LLAFAARRRGIALDDETALAELSAKLDISFPADDDSDVVMLEGEDVTSEIRTEDAGRGASLVAALPAVRKALLERQRNFCVEPGLVADGRDMGTVVFPAADAKVFLTASPEERARRRCKQLKEQGLNLVFEEVLADIKARDERDANRTVAPLRPAADAQLVDTSDLDIPATIERIRSLLKIHLNR